MSSLPTRCSKRILVTPRSPGSLEDSILMKGYLAANALRSTWILSMLSFEANLRKPSFRAPSSNFFCLSEGPSLFISVRVSSTVLPSEALDSATRIMKANPKSRSILIFILNSLLPASGSLRHPSDKRNGRNSSPD